MPIGHRYSWLSQVVDPDTAWVAPLDVERIGPDATPISIAVTQVKRLAKSSSDPLLLVGDREYGVDEVLRRVPEVEGAKLTWSARVRSNLVFYLPPPPRQPGQKGRARLYGARVQLNDRSTWPAPVWRATESTPTGERVELMGWHDWRRRGFASQPVQVVQVRVLRVDGQPKYPQPLWVMLVGDEVAWERVAPLYRCRWREETWHGQAKDVLGWTRAQLGDVKRQDRWTWVVLLAGWQLLLARAGTGLSAAGGASGRGGAATGARATRLWAPCAGVWAGGGTAKTARKSARAGRWHALGAKSASAPAEPPPESGLSRSNDPKLGG